MDRSRSLHSVVVMNTATPTPSTVPFDLGSESVHRATGGIDDPAATVTTAGAPGTPATAAPSRACPGASGWCSR